MASYCRHVGPHADHLFLVFGLYGFLTLASLASWEVLAWAMVGFQVPLCLLSPASVSQCTTFLAKELGEERLTQRVPQSPTLPLSWNGGRCWQTSCYVSFTHYQAIWVEKCTHACVKGEFLHKMARNRHTSIWGHRL